MDFKNIKVALVHDFLLYPGGAEKVLEALLEMFPEAPIYTLLYDKERTRGMFEGREIRTSFLQKFPKFLKKRHQWLLPFYSVATEMFDLRDFDLVISSSGAWSKGIVTKLDVKHIAYVHSPARFLWENSGKYLKENKKEKLGFFLRPLLNYLRIWDFEAAQRPDFLISNSKYTRERIKKYYRRESEVICPGINNCHSERSEESHDLNNKSDYNQRPFASTQGDKEEILKNFFLVVSRLSPYKNIDKIVEAFNKLKLPLVVAGEGKQEKYLRSIAEDNIKILGWQNDEEIEKLYQNARAFVFAADDDFGMAPVEAVSHGVPVIALKKGGVLETVIENKTGEFFDAATPEVIADGVRRFMENEGNYDRQFMIKNAEKFGRERFAEEIGKYIDEKINNLC